MKVVKNIIIYVISFCILLFIVNMYFIGVTIIDGESMYPTLNTGDKLMVNKFIYNYDSLQKGDIIVCRFCTTELDKDFKEKQNNSETYTKRIIATSGDKIYSKDGRMFVNGEDITDKYWKDSYIDDEFVEKSIPNGYVFVIGDNVNNSVDSRIVDCISFSNIVGKVICTIPDFNKVS